MIYSLKGIPILTVRITLINPPFYLDDPPCLVWVHLHPFRTPISVQFHAEQHDLYGGQAYPKQSRIYVQRTTKILPDKRRQGVEIILQANHFP